MKTFLTYYTLACLVLPIAVNYEAPKEAKETVKEVPFWCDCGASIHWKDMMLTKID